MMKPQSLHLSNQYKFPNSIGSNTSSSNENITTQSFNLPLAGLFEKFTDNKEVRNMKVNNKQKNKMSNPIIIEQTTTTTHTKTTCQMKVQRQQNNSQFQLNGPSFNIGMGDISDQFLKNLLERTNPFDNSPFEDLGKPELGELFYSDAMPENISDEVNKIQWLSQVYGSIVNRSQPKTYLLKLVEYNKIQIIDNDQFLVQNIDIEIIMCKLMKQRLINDDLKYQLDTYNFQSILQEQQSLIYALIKLTKKNIHTLYKKCHNFITVQHVQKEIEKRKVSYIYLKDLLHEKRAYIDMARKMGDLYEDMLKKASFFKPFVDKIFESSPVYYYIKCESIFKGFFFLFIYKDFVLREVIELMRELLPKEKQLQVLKQIEEDYEKFMEGELVEWINLMLTCEVFQSYSCIVSPNEVQEKRVRGNHQQSTPQTNPKKERSMEGQNYFALKRKYMKNFLRAYQGQANQRNQVIHLLDSDYDEDDEEYQGEIDEMFNNSVQHSEDYDKDEIDSDDIPTEKEIKFIQQQIMQKTKQEQNGLCEAHRSGKFDSEKSLYEQYKSIDCKQCKQKLLINSHLSAQSNHLNVKNLDQVKSAFQHWESVDLNTLSTQDQFSEQNEGPNQDAQAKKKRKRKRHKKKKKKPEDIANAPLQQQIQDEELSNEEGEKAAGSATANQEELQRESDDDFEEDLKRFELRLQQNESRQSGEHIVKLKPNVSQDWLQSIHEKSKSLTASNSSQQTAPNSSS